MIGPPRVSTICRNFPRSKAIEVHDFVPCAYELAHKLLAGVVARVDFGDGAQLRVRAENEIDSCCGPIRFAGGAVATFESLR